MALLRFRNRREIDPIIPLHKSELADLSFDELHRLINFLDDIGKALLAEMELRHRQNARFIHLLDFDVIYSYIFTGLRQRSYAKSPLSDSVYARRFFEGLSEPFALPTGTKAEISDFLHRELTNLEYYRAATLTQNLDSAIENFGRFLSGSGDVVLEGGTNATAEERLEKAQIAALQVLADAEIGMRRLYNIVTHASRVHIKEVLGDNSPDVIPRKTVQPVHNALQELRPNSPAKANRADAINVALAFYLTEHQYRGARSGELETPTYFRLLTNTRTLYKLDDESLGLAVQFSFLFPGSPYKVNLLEGVDEAYGRRLLGGLAQGENAGRLYDFIEAVGKVGAALARLKGKSAQLKVSNTELLWKLCDPRSQQDRDLLIELQPSITIIKVFLSSWGSFIKPLLDAELRRNIVFCESGDDRRYRLSEKSYTDVAALEEIIRSIQSVIDEVDPLKFDLSPLQAGINPHEWSTPLVTFKSLGLKENRDEKGVWRLSYKETGRPVLTVKHREGSWSAYWPTDSSGTDELLRIFDILDPKSEKQIRLIRYNGAQSILKVKSIIDMSKLREVAFVRLDCGEFTFVSELFSPSPSYILQTGIMTSTPKPDPVTITELFASLTRYKRDLLFLRLLEEEIPRILREL